MEHMKYMTVEERELYEKIVERYKLKGYSIPFSLSCQAPSPETKESKKAKITKKTTARR